MKAVQQPVAVLEADHQPRSFIWNGRAYRIAQILDRWQYGGRWWLGEAGRDCFLVQAGGLTAELHHERGKEECWWLARVQD
ncbi:DUF6504 family protein [Deinococcus sp. Marseille-Q6407]|uniref:DUF6504 family protein n=1 Tax=Deinococcus sp. Marseille-Q6407 TaxID=2969223 RepID=UPI0021BF714D|nr:DUF6504 family protein [Deinococcus sp. Marseille-Q6407]